MGRYSSDSDDSHYRRSKKKKKHARSDSGSSVESYSSRHSKHKRSKKTSKRRHRSRSRSKGRYDRRSRSRSYDRKIRSDDRRRSRSRSRQRSHRKRSESRSRYRRSYSRERSNMRGRSRSRSRSRSRPPKEKIPVVKVEPAANIPGFDNMTPAEQAQARLRLALKAAAAADKQLKDQGLLAGNVPHKTEAAILSLAEQQSRAQAINDIESDTFVPAMFKSTRGQSSSQTPDVNTSHDSAIFGLSSASKTTNIGAIVCMKMESIMHPNLYVSSEEKMERWKEKLGRMRKKIIEQGMMTS
ncbi:hypothetical protein LSAT2_008566 [Lamellibrachia satsuma]|nr:hypothetical protein LSAT2_008566 [Lamellibrachia satsuma]